MPRSWEHAPAAATSPRDDGGIGIHEGEDELDENGARLMSKKMVHRACRARGLYATPTCNTTLYLQDLKFRRIQNLEEFSACKVLHLSTNCLSCIEGLEHMSCLQVLYLQHNDIRSLAPLSTCTSLHMLNVSHNPLRSLEGLPPSLRTLHAVNTGLTSAASLACLAVSCPLLEVLDISGNAGLGADEVAGLGWGPRGSADGGPSGPRLSCGGAGGNGPAGAGLAAGAGVTGGPREAAGVTGGAEPGAAAAGAAQLGGTASPCAAGAGGQGSSSGTSAPGAACSGGVCVVQDAREAAADGGAAAGGEPSAPDALLAPPPPLPAPAAPLSPGPPSPAGSGAPAPSLPAASPAAAAGAPTAGGALPGAPTAGGALPGAPAPAPGVLRGPWPHPVLRALCSIQSLRVLYVMKTPLHKIPNLRRILVSALPRLTYLDDLPVDDCDRRGCEAWLIGGVEAEKAARLAYREERRRAQKRNTVAFAVERARRRVLREMGTAGNDTAALELLLEDTEEEVRRRMGPEPPSLQGLTHGSAGGAHGPLVLPPEELDALLPLAAYSSVAGGSVLLPPSPGAPAAVAVANQQSAGPAPSGQAESSSGGALAGAPAMAGACGGAGCGAAQQVLPAVLVAGSALPGQPVEGGAGVEAPPSRAEAASPAADGGLAAVTAAAGAGGGAGIEPPAGCHVRPERPPAVQVPGEAGGACSGQGPRDSAAACDTDTAGGPVVSPGGWGAEAGTTPDSAGCGAGATPDAERAALEAAAVGGSQQLSECVVCSEAFVEGEQVAVLPCQHFFHNSCIRRWLLGFRNSCPMCRAPVAPRVSAPGTGPAAAAAAAGAAPAAAGAVDASVGAATAQAAQANDAGGAGERRTPHPAHPAPRVQPAATTGAPTGSARAALAADASAARGPARGVGVPPAEGGAPAPVRGAPAGAAREGGGATPLECVGGMSAPAAALNARSNPVAGVVGARGLEPAAAAGRGGTDVASAAGGGTAGVKAPARGDQEGAAVRHSGAGSSLSRSGSASSRSSSSSSAGCGEGDDDGGEALAQGEATEQPTQHGDECAGQQQVAVGGDAGAGAGDAAAAGAAASSGMTAAGSGAAAAALAARGFMSRYSYRAPLPVPKGAEAAADAYEEGCWELPGGATVAAVPYL